MKVVSAPEAYDPEPGEISIFFGGSIELGKAELWQDKLISWLGTQPYASDLVILNPRRPDWDSSISTKDPKNPALQEQITWELACQDRADLLLYYFAAETISPITLFELGLYRAKEPVVGADQDYLRYGNLILTANHFGFTVQTGWAAFTASLHQRLLAMADSSAA